MPRCVRHLPKIFRSVSIGLSNPKPPCRSKEQRGGVAAHTSCSIKERVFGERLIAGRVLSESDANDGWKVRERRKQDRERLRCMMQHGMAWLCAGTFQAPFCVLNVLVNRSLVLIKIPRY